jgi:hypothetical protein
MARAQDLEELGECHADAAQPKALPFGSGLASLSSWRLNTSRKVAAGRAGETAVSNET